MTYSEIPDDIKIAAWDAFIAGERDHGARVTHIANALLAERERCRADLFGDEEKPRYTTKRLRLEIARARADEREQCALIAHCHSDDRPRRDGMDWNDGYMDGCKGAAEAIRKGSPA